MSILNVLHLFLILLIYFKTGSYYTAQAGLEFIILLASASQV
jgi:hypothetical protein